jgi:hypothetical protein
MLSIESSRFSSRRHPCPTALAHRQGKVQIRFLEIQLWVEARIPDRWQTGPHAQKCLVSPKVRAATTGRHLSLRHSAASITMSESACVLSLPDGTRWQGAALVGSRGKLSTRTAVCCASNACPGLPRCGPRSEASRRAGCDSSACPVR